MDRSTYATASSPCSFAAEPLLTIYSPCLRRVTVWGTGWSLGTCSTVLDSGHHWCSTECLSGACCRPTRRAGTIPRRSMAPSDGRPYRPRYRRFAGSADWMRGAQGADGVSANRRPNRQSEGRNGRPGPGRLLILTWQRGGRRIDGMSLCFVG